MTDDERTTGARAINEGAAGKMKMRAWSIAALLVIAATASRAAAQEMVVVVRHAERADDSADSPLSAYDNLFVVFPQQGAPPLLLRLRY